MLFEATSVASNSTESSFELLPHSAGPKLRKWYGEGERKQGEKGKPGPEDENEGPGDAILVTDADSPLGELVLLQLILAR